MKKIALYLAFCLLANLFGCTNTDKSKPATAEELSQMNRDFVKALNAKDAVAAANCYTEDATLLPPNEARTCQYSKVLGRCYCSGCV